MFCLVLDRYLSEDGTVFDSREGKRQVGGALRDHLRSGIVQSCCPCPIADVPGKEPLCFTVGTGQVHDHTRGVCCDYI